MKMLKLNFDKETKICIQAISVIVMAILVVAIGWKLLGVLESGVRKVDITPYNENQEIEYAIENLSWSEAGVTISGWCLMPGENIDYAEMYLVLEENGVYYQVPTMIEQRDNVTELFNDGYSYGYSGFYSLIDFQRFRIEENQDFNLYMIYKNNGREDIVNLNTTLRGWGQ